MALTLVLLGGGWTGRLRHPETAAASIFLSFICCIIAHNHMHRPVFRGRRWNELFQLLLMFGSGQPPTGIITAHNERHHGDPDSERDPVRNPIITALQGYKQWFTGLAALLGGLVIGRVLPRRKAGGLREPV